MSSAPRINPAAQCYGKLRFNTFTSADRAARRSRRSKARDSQPLQAYHCHSCSGFHVGNTGKKAARRPRYEPEE